MIKALSPFKAPRKRGLLQHRRFTLGGGGAVFSDHWITSFGAVRVNGVTSTPDGGICVVGRADILANAGVIAKFTKFGELVWQRQYDDASSQNFNDVTADSSGNLYAVGSSVTAAAIVKYSSDGTLLWQRRLVSPSSAYFTSVGIGSDGGIYATGAEVVSGYHKVLTAKYNSDGSLAWQRRLSTGSTVNDVGNGIACAATGNVYVGGYYGTNSLDIALVKYTNSGTLSWQRRSTTTTLSEIGYDCAVDSSENIYVCGYVSGSGTIGNLDWVLVKYDSAGVWQWQKYIGAGFSDVARHIAIDAEDNVFVAGYTQPLNGGGSVSGAIIKCSPSGDILWQRTLGGGFPDAIGHIIIDNEGAIVVVGQSESLNPDGTGDGFIARLPADGTLTGVYGDIVYAEGSMSAIPGTMTLGSTAATGSTPALTQNTPTIADASSTFPATKIPQGGTYLSPPFVFGGSAVSSTTSTGSLNLTTRSVGDLVILQCNSSNSAMAVPAGWTDLGGASTTTRRCCKVLASGDLTNLTLSFTSSGVHIVRSVVVAAGTFDPTLLPTVSINNTAASNNPTIVSGTAPAGFAGRNNAVISFATWSSDTITVSGYPYANANAVSEGSSGTPRVRMAVASQPFMGRDYPGGEFIRNGSTSWGTYTYVIAGTAP